MKNRNGSLLVGLLVLAGLFIGGYMLLNKTGTNPPPSNPPINQPINQPNNPPIQQDPAANLKGELKGVYNQIQEVRTQYNQAVSSGNREKAEELRKLHNELVYKYKELQQRIASIEGQPQGNFNPGNNSGNGQREAFSGNRNQIQADAEAILSSSSNQEIKDRILREFRVTIGKVDKDFPRDELITMYGILRSMPPGFIRPQTISRANNHSRGGSISGVTTSSRTGSSVRSDIVIYNASHFDFANTLVHELTHAWAFQTQSYAKWDAQFNASQSPTAYGKSSSHEDICETVAMYYTNPEKLLRVDSARYQAVKSMIFQSKQYL